MVLSCSYKLLSVEVSGGAPGEDGGLRRFHVDSLSWFGSSGPAGELNDVSDSGDILRINPKKLITVC